MVRNRVLVSIFLITTACMCFAGKEDSVQDLASRAEAARIDDRPGLYLQAAQLQLKKADDLYETGDSEKARAAIDDVVTYSQKAVEAATQSGKKLKHTEIHIRKIAQRLVDIKRSVAFEDQGPVQSAIDRLQTLRTELLSKMFGSKD